MKFVEIIVFCDQKIGATCDSTIHKFLIIRIFGRKPKIEIDYYHVQIRHG